MGITNVSISYIIFNYWPLILIIFGLELLIKRKGSGELTTGLILILIGGLILGAKQGLYQLYLSTIMEGFLATSHYIDWY